ncbi:uncharacterized protein LOC144359467 [Saccoglossus kowalevskii]
MPFGIMNSGATMVRGVRKMLSGMCSFVSYVDDILVHTITWCEHLTALKELFTKMPDAQLTAIPSMCIIASVIIDFVCRRVGQGFRSPHEDNVKKLKSEQQPKNTSFAAQIKDTSFLKAFNKSAFVLHNVIGDSDKQGPRFGLLKPHKNLVVPNIAHFIWFSCHDFHFHNLISVLSVHRVMQAERILFHTDCEPSGMWWYEARMLIPQLEIVHRDRPKRVFGIELNPKWPEHSADVARLQVLLEMGGVYLDADVFIVAPLEPLRHYDYVAGRETDAWLNNGIIVAKNESRFLKQLYESYKKYEPTCWACLSVIHHNQLALEHLNIVHIEHSSMNRPGSRLIRDIFEHNYKWQIEHFSIHTFIRLYVRWMRGQGGVHLTPATIKTFNSTVGEICRYIYYGSPDIIRSKHML